MPMPSDTPRSGPLSHIKVLDLTTHLAGPYATQILGDLGAQIIKLEVPGGESTRHMPPHYIAGNSTYFHSINRNKQSIVVDLKSPEGKQVATDLADQCDIVIENARPGVMHRLGLSYDDLSPTRPGMIYCSLSGFGQDGPDRDLPALDIIVQALSGGMSMTGEKGGKAVRAGLPIGDVCAGMYCVIGVLAALANRTQTGKGDYIDVAMLDVQVAFLCYQAAAYFHTGKAPGRQGREHDMIPLINCFEAKDGIEVVIAGNSATNFRTLSDFLGVPELPEDPRYKEPRERLKNKESLVATLRDAFKTKTSTEIMAHLRKEGVPVGIVHTVDKALESEQLKHRNMILELKGGSDEERARVVGDPIKIRRAGRKTHTFAPRIGADSRYILGDVLGYDSAKIDALLKSGAVQEKGLAKAAE
jgi:CoA:oxalate CoA-transferase